MIMNVKVMLVITPTICLCCKDRQNMKHVSCLIWGITEESLFSLGSLKEKSVSLLLKFHENGDESLNIYKAAENKMWNTEKGIEFFMIVRMPWSIFTSVDFRTTSLRQIKLF